MTSIVRSTKRIETPRTQKETYSRLEVSPDSRPGMDEVVDRLELIHAMLKAGVKSSSGQMKAVKE